MPHSGPRVMMRCAVLALLRSLHTALHRARPGPAAALHQRQSRGVARRAQHARSGLHPRRTHVPLLPPLPAYLRRMDWEFEQIKNKVHLR